MRTSILLIGALIVGVATGVGTAFIRVDIAPSDTAALLAGGAGTEGSPQPGQPRPKVFVDQTKYDFGTLDDKATGSHEFVFTNHGDAPLKLNKGDTTCRCTVVDMEEITIAPGGSANVKIQWHAKNLAGPYRQNAAIMTNDPDQSRVTLTITGRITAALRVSPTDVVFSHLSVGESATAQLRVYCYLPEQLKITGYTLDDDADAGDTMFAVSYEPLSADQIKEEADVKSGYLVSVTAKSGLRLGAFQQRIHLATNLKASPEIEVPVEGTIGSDISVVGRGWNEKNGVLTIGTVAGAEGAQQSVLLTCRGSMAKDVKYRITQVEPHLLKVQLGEPNEVNDGKATLTPLTIEIPKGSPPVNCTGPPQGDYGRITIETNHPRAPLLRILVRFAVEG